MIIFKGQRFACISCIRGHRGVKCTHISELLLSVKRLCHRKTFQRRVHYRLGFVSGKAIMKERITAGDLGIDRTTIHIKEDSPCHIYVTTAGDGNNSGNLGIIELCKADDVWFGYCCSEIFSRFGHVVFDEDTGLDSPILRYSFNEEDTDDELGVPDTIENNKVYTEHHEISLPKKNDESSATAVESKSKKYHKTTRVPNNSPSSSNYSRPPSPFPGCVNKINLFKDRHLPVPLPMVFRSSSISEFNKSSTPTKKTRNLRHSQEIYSRNSSDHKSVNFSLDSNQFPESSIRSTLTYDAQEY